MADRSREEGLFRALIGAIGLTATVTGIYVVLTGTAGQPDGGSPTASVESELRFFGSFWLAYGLATLWLARRAGPESAAFRLIALALFTGGIARALAWAAEGRPDPLFVVLMALELIVPVLVVLWQRRLIAAGGAPRAEQALRLRP